MPHGDPLSRAPGNERQKVSCIYREVTGSQIERNKYIHKEFRYFITSHIVLSSSLVLYLGKNVKFCHFGTLIAHSGQNMGWIYAKVYIF